MANLPAGSTVETTARLLDELSRVIARVPEVSDYRGLRRHRRADQLQRPGAPVLPARRPPSSARSRWSWCRRRCASRKSHAIALAVRPALAAIAPPRITPPSRSSRCRPGRRCRRRSWPRSTGRDYAEQVPPRAARSARCSTALRASSTWTISVVAPSPRLVVDVDRQKAALLGVSQEQVTRTLGARPLRPRCDVRARRRASAIRSRCGSSCRWPTRRGSRACSRSTCAPRAARSCRSQELVHVRRARIGSSRSTTRTCCR